MYQGVVRVLNQSIKLLVNRGYINKVEEFAELLGWSDQQLVKRLNCLTMMTMEEFWKITEKIKELDPNTYQEFIRSVLMDLTLGR